MSRERPLLFSAPMVRALVAGTKTQTRRIVRVDDTPIQHGDGPLFLQRGIPSNAANVRHIGPYLKCDAPKGSNTVSSRVPCPFGVVGDRLWVRETFAAPPGSTNRDEAVYRADIPPEQNGEERWARRHMPSSAPWTPPIHMPRWASRLTLEITAVGVERLQSITTQDACAEGVRHDGEWWLGGKHPIKGTPKVFGDPRQAFESIWDELNGDRAPWASNPWVWVLTFRVATERAAGAGAP
ncbi:MAG TPA: hypothetical protein VF765_31210 [Polyangiaceae bacterium]